MIRVRKAGEWSPAEALGGDGGSVRVVREHLLAVADLRPDIPILQMRSLGLGRGLDVARAHCE